MSLLRSETLSTSTCDSTSAVQRDIPWSEDWQHVLRNTMDDMSCPDHVLLVTDIMGIEVTGHEWRRQHHASIDRFPLRVRLMLVPVPVASPGSKGDHTSTARSVDTTSDSSSSGDTKSKGWQGNQVIITVRFEDVWPGALRRKLQPYGVDSDSANGGDGFVVATDVRGVEVKLNNCKGSARNRMPSPDRFPLKLHFKAMRSGRQYIDPAKATDFRRSNSKEKSDWQNRNDRRSASKDNPQAEWQEHSLELPLSGIVEDVLTTKLEDMGVHIEESLRSCILVTDCLGVIVDLTEGVPDRSRFPLKAYIEGKQLSNIETTPDHSRWYPFKENNNGDAMATRVSQVWGRAWKSLRRAKLRLSQTHL